MVVGWGPQCALLLLLPAASAPAGINLSPSAALRLGCRALALLPALLPSAGSAPVSADWAVPIACMAVAGGRVGGNDGLASVGHGPHLKCV